MIQFSVRNYSTGRPHRLVFNPNTPGTYSVKCRVYYPGEVRCTETFQLKPVDAAYEFHYQFRQLGDYLLVLIKDLSIVHILKAVVEK